MWCSMYIWTNVYIVITEISNIYVMMIIIQILYFLIWGFHNLLISYRYSFLVLTFYFLQ